MRRKKKKRKEQEKTKEGRQRAMTSRGVIIRESRINRELEYTTRSLYITPRARSLYTRFLTHIFAQYAPFFHKSKDPFSGFLISHYILRLPLPCGFIFFFIFFLVRSILSIRTPEYCALYAYKIRSNVRLNY